MFSHADRFPLGPAAIGTWPIGRPWGLSRMEPFKSMVEVGAVPVGLDPRTQTARYRSSDGIVTLAEHRKTGTGTERGTQTRSKGGDGNAPTSDQDHSQDSDSD
jgi:putative ATP-grasp target RiPP